MYPSEKIMFQQAQRLAREQGLVLQEAEGLVQGKKVWRLLHTRSGQSPFGGLFTTEGAWHFLLEPGRRGHAGFGF